MITGLISFATSKLGLAVLAGLAVAFWWLHGLIPFVVEMVTLGAAVVAICAAPRKRT